METQTNKRLIALFGASGHAKVILDILEKSGDTDILGLFDDDAGKRGKSLLGYPVLGGREALIEHAAKHPKLELIISIGINDIRMTLADWFRERSMRFGTAVHPSAIIGRQAVIGRGTVIMATCAVNPDARIGDHAIINTGATVDHDCSIGNGVHIAPGVSICGGVTIGDSTLVGVGARVLPNRKIGANTVIGAGAVVTKDIPDGVTVIGCPARPLDIQRMKLTRSP